MANDNDDNLSDLTKMGEEARKQIEEKKKEEDIKKQAEEKAKKEQQKENSDSSEPKTLF